MKSSRQLFVHCFIAASLLIGGLALAQPEPTMDQIYSTAKAGRLDEAQVMVQQVLVSHPKSAKAFYVQAELYARQGNLERARASGHTSWVPAVLHVKKGLCPEALCAGRI